MLLFEVHSEAFQSQITYHSLHCIYHDYTVTLNMINLLRIPNVRLAVLKRDHSCNLWTSCGAKQG